MVSGERRKDLVTVRIHRPGNADDILFIRSVDLFSPYSTRLAEVEEIATFWKALWGPRVCVMTKFESTRTKHVTMHDGNAVFQDTQFGSWVLMTLDLLEA